MGIQNSINSLLGTAATIAEVANISKGIKAGNALKEESLEKTLQGRELDADSAIIQNKIDINNANDEIANLNKQLEGVLEDRATLRSSRRHISPDIWYDLQRREKSIGFNIKAREDSIRNLQGQLAGREAQLKGIRARMKQMGVESLLSKGGNE